MVKIDIIVDLLAILLSAYCFARLLTVHQQLGSKTLGFFLFAVAWSAVLRVAHILEHIFPRLNVSFSLWSAVVWPALILGLFFLEKDIDMVLDRLIEMRKKQKEQKS